MPGPLLFLALGAIALLGLAVALLTLRRTRRNLAAATAAAETATAHARRLGQLAAEVQAPGLALLGQAERVAGLPDGTGPAAAIASEAQRLLRLSDELSELLAAGAGPRQLREEAVPLWPLLQEAIAATAAQLGPATRQWRLSDDFQDLVLQADRRALRGALLQVLVRAARLSRDGDWVELRPELTPESVAIVVEDEGLGLPAEDLSVANDGAEHTRGLCFGLSVARSLLRAHGGELALEAAPGIGARAWVTVPRTRLLEAARQAA